MRNALNVVLLASVIVASQSFCSTGMAQETAPTKEALIKLLGTVYPLLETKDFKAAAPYFALPEGVDPSELDGMIERREVSKAGIRALEKSAKFGKALEIMDPDNAKHFCERMGADPAKTYGFYYSDGEATGEVLAEWKEGRFQLIRLDDVGKLAPAETTKLPGETKGAPADTINPMVGATESKPAEKTAAELAAEKEAELAKVAQSIAALEKEVTDNPKDAGARANYAMALYKLKSYPAAWEQIYEASKLEPKHGGIARGVNACVNAFTNLGVYTVGVPTETIKSLMGEPSQKVKLGENRERWVYANWGIDFKDGRVHEIVNLLGATGALYKPTEVVSVEFDGRGWRTGFRQKQKGKVLAYVFVDGQNMANYTERITIERILDASSIGTMQQIGQKMIDDERKVLPKSKHKVIEATDVSLIMAVELPTMPGFQGEQKLVRMMKGPKDLHRLAYSIKADEPPAMEVQMKWLNIFKAASLKSVGE